MMTKRFQPRGSANFPDRISAGGVDTTGLGTASATNAITAHAGGGQASATQLSSRINRITTVATAADSVKLPASAAGTTVTVINSGANSAQVFGTTPDTINGVATGTGVALAAGKVAEFICAVAGAWSMNLSA